MTSERRVRRNYQRASELRRHLYRAQRRTASVPGERARELEQILGHASDLAHEIYRDFRRSAELVASRELAQTVERARDLIGIVGVAYGLACTTDLQRELDFGLKGATVREFDGLLEESRRLNGAVERLVEPERASLRRGGATVPCEVRPPGRTVSFLIVLAARLIPAAHRLRYTEEFRVEAWELPRRTRLAYTFRLIRMAPALRRGLNDVPAGRGARSGMLP